MCFYCDREVKRKPQTWWYKNYVCLTCRVQNGIKNNPMTLEIEKTNSKHRRSDFYCVFYTNVYIITSLSIFTKLFWKAVG